MADTVREAVEENALGPRKASGDSGSVEQHPLKDQIEAARFEGAQSAAGRIILVCDSSNSILPGGASGSALRYPPSVFAAT